jgi:hypothetical protein
MKNVYSNYFYNVGNSEYVGETAVTLDQYIAIVRATYVFHNSVARWQSRGGAAHAAILVGFWYTEMEELTHFTINGDRWQEVTVCLLSTATEREGPNGTRTIVC